jgi:imidazole glycerol-phosphate synthase subunit HisF
MLKKRLIFTLLYNHGQFMLSRNFRLQKVGDLRWLQKNYNFSQVSFSIDELVVLDVSRSERDEEAFCAALKNLTEGCFVPIAAGGGIRSLQQAQRLLRSGADKVVVNTPLFENTAFIEALASEFGQQCVVASIDIKKTPENLYQIWSECGSKLLPGTSADWIERISQLPIGELYLNSMDKDGTGQGLDLNILDSLPTNLPQPVILAGGVGNSTHLAEGLADTRVDAIATAHLFNFVGNGLSKARQTLVSSGIVLPVWDTSVLRHAAEQ